MKHFFLSSLSALTCVFSAFAAPGDLDSLNADLRSRSLESSFYVFVTAVQPDDKVIIVGTFASVLGQPRKNIARLNADGTLDAKFNPNVMGSVISVAVQADGRILLAGEFSVVGGLARNNIARLAADGALDEGFNPNANSRIQGIAVQSDGKILLSGSFTTVGGIARNRIARVAADGTLDPGFNPNANGYVSNVAVQEDGRILLCGGFTTVGGITRNCLARVAGDGTLDPGFNPDVGGFSTSTFVTSLVVQADGRILFNGNYTTVGGISRRYVARVTGDGTLDRDFDPKANSYVQSVAVQADGRILLGGSFTGVGGFARNHIARVAADGALDAGFNPNASNPVRSLAVQADGRILLGGDFFSVGGTTRRVFARLLNDPATQSLVMQDSTQARWIRSGSVPEVWQTTFELSIDGGRTYASLPGTATRAGQTADWQLTGLTLPPLGHLRVRGRTSGGFQNCSSGLVESEVRFGPAGQPIVTAISPASGSPSGGTRVTITGTHLTGATAVTIGGLSVTNLSVVNATTITATTPAGPTGPASVLVTTPGGTNAAEVYFAYAAPTVTLSAASLVNTSPTLTISGANFSAVPGNNRVFFTPAGTGTVTAASDTQLIVSSLSGLSLGALYAVITTHSGNSGAPVQVAMVAGPPAGTLEKFNPSIAGNSVSTMAVQSDGKVLVGGSYGLVRLNADGTSDRGFSTNGIGGIFSVAVQADGKILVGGSLGIARVAADGTRDTDFNPNPNGTFTGLIHGIQADGKILLGTVSSSGQNVMVRVAADGKLDSGFNPTATGAIYSAAVQEDGKILLGGSFTTLNRMARAGLARVAADGTLDPDFNPNGNGTFTGAVYCIAVQADGRILLGGTFTSVGGTGRNRLARLHANGTLDESFNPNVEGTVHSVILQADGQVLLGGTFSRVSGMGRSFVARVGTDGKLDPNFNPNPDSTVSSMAVQADGQILLGGGFTNIGGTGRNRIARLFNDPATQSVTAADSTQLFWSRSGSAPEVLQTSFELSIDGGTTYTPLAENATRVGQTANWQLGRLSLPANGHIRARGRTSGGNHSNSSGLVESEIKLGTAGVPMVTAISPADSGAGGGSRVTITGSHFTGATEVTIGGVRATGVSVVNATTITATTPPGATGTASVLVTTPGGTNAANKLYSYLSPTVTRSTGILVNTGTFLTITGTNFSTVPGKNSVVFTPAASSTISAATATSLTVTGLSGLTQGVLYAVVSTNGENSGAPVPVATVVAPGIGDPDAYNAAVLGSGVFAMVEQPDGRTLLAGSFFSVLGQPRNNIARLNADGTLDVGFNPNVNGSVYSLVVQADGRILLGGSFTTVGVTVHGRIARLNADGTPDPGFDPDASGTVNCVGVQEDGKILLGGSFTSVGGRERNRIARLESDGTADTGFNPNANGVVNSIALQEDGRILLGGEFTNVGGIMRNRIARVAADGVPDREFNPTADDTVNSLLVQADGKILMGGNFPTVLKRLAADGTPDPGFYTRITGSGLNVVYSLAMQADGRILLGGRFDSLDGIARHGIARLAADGTLDPDFDPNVIPIVKSVAVQADGKVLIGGFFSRVGASGREKFARLMSDSAKQRLTVADNTQVLWTRSSSSPEVSQVTFELSTNGGVSYTRLSSTPARVGNTASWQVTGLSLPDTGHLRVHGRTSGGYFNGSSGLVGAAVSYTVAPSIVPTVTAIFPISGRTAGGTPVVISGSGFTGATAVFIGGGPAEFTVLDDTRIRATTPAHAAGTASVVVSAPGTNAANTLYTYIALPTLNPSSSNLLGSTTTFTITGSDFSPTPGDNRIVFTPTGIGTVTSATSTSLTVSALSGLTLGALSAVVTTKGLSSGDAVKVANVIFPPPGTRDNTLPGGFVNINDVNTVAVQPDGKLIITGQTGTVRLNANDTLDGGFNPKPSWTVNSVVVQPDGHILLGGFFTSVNGIPRSGIARVAADGSLDPDFNPVVKYSINSLAVQADGRILLAGLFNSVNGTERNRIARLNTDVTLEMDFNPDVNDTIHTLAVQADGRILLGGRFTSVGGIARNRIARLNADGTLDRSFNPNANGMVFNVTVQADGQMLLAGLFTTVRGIGRNGIARVTADGTLDIGFDPNPDSSVLSLGLQADGRILLGGNFNSVGGIARNHIARVAADGSLDAAFDPGKDIVNYRGVDCVSIQANGKILIGGNSSFMRLHNDLALQILSVPDTTKVLWMRSGSAPEVSQVTFELSTDGGTTYTRLPGTATRVASTANWQLSGLSLPASGLLRARGRTSGGYLNSGSGLVESVVAFPVALTAIGIWRQTHFGVTDNIGSAADTTDFDNDGLVNLIEFAFGLNPTDPASVDLPQLLENGSEVSLAFTTPSGVSGITYGAESSTTLQPGSWTVIPDTGTAPQHRFIVPTTGQKKAYLRFIITAGGP